MSLYTSLPDKCIRVLSIKGTRLIDVPGSSFQDLAFVCELETISLRDVETGSIQYSALSYVWGNVSPSFCRYIVCNGQRMSVTMNLHNALRQIAFNSNLKLRRLWVDALCIDQDDVIEKSHQVGMMGEIYRNAELVVIWMGSGSEDTRDDLACACESLSSGCAYEIPLNTFFASHEWLRRAWTFQEIILAQDAVVLVGPFMIPWQRLCQSNPPDPLVSKIEDLRQRATTARFADLITASDGRQSLDPRDRIYSLLGIYHRDHRNQILQPDYTKSVAEVFAEAAHQVILELGRLVFVDLKSKLHAEFMHGGIIMYISLEENGVSWCPDWTNSHFRPRELAFPQKENLLEFKNLHPQFTMQVQLRGCRLRAAGAMLGYWAGERELEGSVPLMDFLRLPDCHSAIRLGDLFSGSITNYGARIAQSKNSLRQLRLFADADETLHTIHHHTFGDCVCKHSVDLTPPSVSATISNVAGQAWRFIGQGESGAHSSAANDADEARGFAQSWPLLLCILFGAEVPVILKPVKYSTSKPVSFRLCSQIDKPESWTENLLQLGLGHERVVQDRSDPYWNKLRRLSFLPTYFELE